MRIIYPDNYLGCAACGAKLVRVTPSRAVEIRQAFPDLVSTMVKQREKAVPVLPNQPSLFTDDELTDARAIENIEMEGAGGVE